MRYYGVEGSTSTLAADGNRRMLCSFMEYVYTQLVDACGMWDFGVSLLILCIWVELKGVNMYQQNFPEWLFFRPPYGIDSTILEYTTLS